MATRDMPRFEEILGQRAPIDLLRRLLASERVPQAMLFQGPEGVGKAKVACAFAATLLCENARESGCGDCSACRMRTHGGHPDLWTIGLLPREPPSARAGEPRSNIVVDQIRELSSVVGLAPREGRHRIYIIDPADLMTTEAQNALLKTLEEPPGRAVLLLIASRPHLLLPTVRSRCFSLGFSAMPPVELARQLELRGLSPAEAAARAALAEGRVGPALELDVELLRDRREALLTMLESLSSSRKAYAELTGYAASLAGKDEPTLRASLDLLQGLLRDAARADAGADPTRLVHTDLSGRLSKLGRGLGRLRAAALVRSVERLRADLRFNVNRSLVAESLLAAVAGGPLP